MGSEVAIMREGSTEEALGEAWQAIANGLRLTNHWFTTVSNVGLRAPTLPTETTPE